FVLALDLRFVAAVQAWRWAGLEFLTLYTYGILPGVFAWPAGLGDMIVGFSAPPWYSRSPATRPLPVRAPSPAGMSSAYSIWPWRCAWARSPRCAPVALPARSRPRRWRTCRWCSSRRSWCPSSSCCTRQRCCRDARCGPAAAGRRNSKPAAAGVPEQFTPSAGARGHYGDRLRRVLASPRQRAGVQAAARRRLSVPADGIDRSGRRAAVAPADGLKQGGAEILAATIAAAGDANHDRYP